ALTETEKRLYKKLTRRENTMFLFQDGPGLEKILSTLEFTDRRDTPTDDDQETPEIHFYSSPDTHGQVFALNEILRKEERMPDEKTVVVLPSSETLFPLLRQSLSILDEQNYNISIGYPIVRTPIFGFLNNLMELVANMDQNRVYIPDYLTFALHPYTKNISFDGRSEITRIMFHTIEEYLTGKRTKTFAALPEIENDRNLLEIILRNIPDPKETKVSAEKIKRHLSIIHDRTIRKFLMFDDVKDFSSKCIDVLTYIYDSSTARLHPLFYPFVESFIQSFDAIGRSLMKDTRFSERSSYFNFFRKYAMTRNMPFEGTPLRGLQVLGLLETRCIRFRKVFILDANEEVIPDTRREYTMIPHKAREILGLPTYKDRDRLIEHYFDTLVKGADEAHLFFVENDKKEKSRFVERYIWELQKRDGNPNAERYIRTVAYRVTLKNRMPEAVKKTEGVLQFLKTFRFSPTALDTYLTCQLEFYFRYVLNIGKKEELSGDIERSDIGKCVHRVLAEYFSLRRGYILGPDDIVPGVMNGLLDRAFAQDYGKNISGAPFLLKSRMKVHLKDLLLKYYLPLLGEEPLTVLDTERKIRIRKKSFHLEGRLDSIERRGKRIVIIDYKTGSDSNSLRIKFDKLDLGKRETWAEAIGSIQLPFYLLLYSETTGANINDLGGMFLLLGQNAIGKGIELPLFRSDEEKKFFPLLERVIFGILREIVDHRALFRPATDKKHSCPACDYRYLCGTQWVVKTGRK
ncbi:MAG: PD-(D/E)XK nuclease family protein, partial [Nitrospirota bacterium]